MARAFRKGKQPFGIGRAQPLEGQRQSVIRVELIPLRFCRERMRRQVRGRHLVLRHEFFAIQTQPAIFTPYAFLDGGLAAKNRAVEAGQRSTAQMHHVGPAIRRLDEIAMPAALQRCIRVEP
ncbi:hypothetical protein D3C87_1567270 [compost metagenome]